MFLKIVEKILTLLLCKIYVFEIYSEVLMWYQIVDWECVRKASSTLTLLIFTVDHEDKATVQVYIVAQKNRVVFTFNNTASYVEELRWFVS